MSLQQEEYVVWSNEHSAWWGPDNAGYYTHLASAGRYSRDEAIKICIDARGGRRFNDNPTEVPLRLSDAEQFWPDETAEWRSEKWERRQRDREREEAFQSGDF